MKRIYIGLMVVMVALAACGAPAEAEVATERSTSAPVATAVTEEMATTPAPTDRPTAMPTATPVPLPTLGPVTVLPDEEAELILYALLSEDFTISGEALRRIIIANDPRFVPVLIDMLYFDRLNVTPRAQLTEHVETLELLTGVFYGDDWIQWAEWYAGQDDITPPPGYATWKGLVLGRLSSGFRSILQDGQPARIRVEDIQWGGVAFDGIPALDNPAMIPGGAVTYLDPAEPVFGLYFNGEARAYPLRIMDWHEMANDTVGGVEVALAYCTLCGSAIAYRRVLPEAVSAAAGLEAGQPLTFGSSGLLYSSNKLMFDRETLTLWSHITGEPVYGPLAESGIVLERLPVVLTTWGEWLALHPKTTALDIVTGHNRQYEPGTPYGVYFEGEEVWFPVFQRSTLLSDKARVYAIVLNGAPKAYPVGALTQDRVVNDVLGGVELVLIADPDEVIVDGTDFVNQRVVNYSAGLTVRAYASEGIEFALDDDGQVVDADGTVWTVTEEALVGPDGRELARLPGHLAYWFGWFNFYPRTEVYSATGR